MKLLKEIVIVMVAALALACILKPRPAHADALYRVQSDGAVVTLHDEPCRLDAVVNLPHRAVWTEGGKTFEGCWGGHSQARAIVTYWADRTVALIPMSALQRVQSS